MAAAREIFMVKVLAIRVGVSEGGGGEEWREGGDERGRRRRGRGKL
jgi:hypothetical protein